MSRLRLSEEDWPSHDRSAKEAACAKAQRFHRGPAAHWASTSCAVVFGDYGRCLGYLANYEPEVLAEHPVERLTLGISKSQVSKLCKDIDERVNAFLDRPIEGAWPYLWLDATYLKVREGAASSRWRQ